MIRAALTRPRDPDAYVHADRDAVPYPHDAHPTRVDPRPAPATVPPGGDVVTADPSRRDNRPQGHVIDPPPLKRGAVDPAAELARALLTFRQWQTVYDLAGEVDPTGPSDHVTAGRDAAALRVAKLYAESLPAPTTAELFHLTGGELTQ